MGGSAYAGLWERTAELVGGNDDEVREAISGFDEGRRPSVGMMDLALLDALECLIQPLPPQPPVGHRLVMDDHLAARSVSEQPAVLDSLDAALAADDPLETVESESEAFWQQFSGT